MVPSNLAGFIISTLELAFTLPFTVPEIKITFALISAFTTAPSETITVSFENTEPLTIPAILATPLKERLPSNLQPSSIIAEISPFCLGF